ncbi:hypothetical protein IQ249_14440 [Lusitaniella coriacea LEGE 07157]|uniref:Uncharacterized protein n=1 Tax=Lusitaniella coriacea LEGE 07157 TaxID=945747 RepID=A0A8J7DXD1_9CYAN|nr:hypothetical protein [Lusitaniella coriacea]MBE9117097.1 hypothetical protein [Lusitaniella coriacea LEGE 07157]
MKTVKSRPRTAPIARKKLRPKVSPYRRRGKPSVLFGIAKLLGFGGMILNSILTGSIAYLGLTAIWTGGIRGWLMGFPAIAIALLSTFAGLGAIYINYKPLTASRLMTIAAIVSLIFGSLLSFADWHILPLALVNTAFLGISAIATLLTRPPRKKRMPVVRYHRKSPTYLKD